MRRALKISAWAASGLLALVIMLVAMLLVAGNTESGRALIERLTARLTSGEVQLAGISGSFPAALDLARLQLSDEQGIWLTAERISLRWTPSALLLRHIRVDSLRVAKLHIERAPVKKPKKHKSEPYVPHIDAALVQVDTLELGAPLAGAPTSLVVTGNAELRSLQNMRANVQARRTNGDGAYQLQLAFDAARMDGTVRLQEPAGGPLEHLIDLPSLGALSALVTIAGPRSAERIELSIDAGPLRARAQGNINLTALSGDLDYSLEAPAMGPAPGLSWQRVSLQGKYHGPITAPVADGRLQVSDLQTPGGVRIAALDAKLNAAAGKLGTRATIEKLVIPGPQPYIFEDAPITIEAAVLLDDPSRPLSLTASHRLFALRGRAIMAGKQSADIDLRLPDIAPLAAMGSQDVKGSANIKAVIARTSDATRLTLDLVAALSGGAPLWSGLLGQNTRLQFEGAMSEAAFDIARLQLTGRALTASVTGSARRSATRDVSARWDLKVSDIATLLPAASGTLSSSGRLKGPANDLTADANLASTASIRGSPPESLSATLHAEGLPTAPRGSVQAQGVLDAAPLRVYASLQRDNDKQLHAVIRQGDWKSAHLVGEAWSDAQMAQARGEFRLRIGDLSDLQRLIDTNLRGHVAATLTLRPVRDRTHVQLQMDAGDIVMGALGGNLQLTAVGATDALDIKLAAQLPDMGGASLTLNSASTLNLSAHELRVTSAESGYHGQTIHLLGPATISFADGVTVAGLKVGAQQAVLEAQGRLTPALDLRASLRQVGPELINAFVPDLLAKGLIEGDAAIQGSTTAPNGHVALKATGLRSKNDAARGLPPVNVDAGAQLSGGAAALDVKLTAGSGSHLTLTGPAPLSPDGTINVELAGNLDLALLNPFLEVHGQHAAGQLIVDTAITGVAKEPDIGGTVRLERGNLRDYAHGVNLTNITGQFVGGHGILTIEHLTARAVSGDVSVGGTIGVLEPKVPIDLKLTAKDAQPITSNIITANVNADLRATGTAREHLDVSGTIGVNRANIQIPNSLPPNVAVLDVRRPGQAPPPRDEKPLVIALSVMVQAPRQILVQGRGLDAELGGELRIRGTTDDPRVSGGFELQRGNFSLASTRLTFNQGTVTFNGSGLKDKIDPTLDFTAQSQVTDTTVTLKITGLADAPKIELSSSPDLPQDEILARLLFGQPASQLTALQAAQIGAALASLSGSGGLNPLAKIQKTLGLDMLSVGSNSNNSTAPGSSQNQGATIEAGRYVSSRVFVAVKQTTTGSSQLAVDVDLSKHLKLQTRLGNGSATAQGTTPENDPGSSIGLGYQFEY